MLPKWFNDWNRDNPKNIFGPAILIGAIGGAVFLAALIVTWGQPYATASIQTGPRGTGMSVTKFADAPAVDPTLEAYTTEEPIVPEGGEDLAKDIYENVQVLGDLTDDNFNRLMLAITEWVSPEQGCAYCHGDEGEFASDDLYTKVVSRRMIQMTQTLNDDWGGHTQVVGAGVNCYTCHRGENVPSNIWFQIDPVNEAASGWSANQNRVTSQSGSTSLPSDALHKLLGQEGLIKVHDLESQVPTEEGRPSIQDTERTYSLMNYISNSLNVNCNFCHNSRAFYDGAEVTPQWATALLGIDMVREMNQEYLTPLRDTYPENRLGPVHGDAPKAACATCHKGWSKPMGGADMISDWPELAAPGAPEYE
ncbi:MAG: photosynthetic reaction center cytochrome PufC [Pseudomonadota bacterium]